MRMTLAAGVLAASLIAAGAASAQDSGVTSGPYIGAGLGYSILKDEPFSGGTLHSNAKYDDGWGGLLTFGYRINPNFRAELEGGFRRNDISSNAPGLNSGHSDAWSGMVNVLYDIRTGTDFTPYIGVGGGWLEYKAKGIAPSGTTSIDHSDGNWGYQGIAGVSYDITPRTQAFLDYHYLASANDPTVRASNGEDVKTKYRNHLITVGFRFMLGAAPAAAPAPAPAPAPVATPAPQPAPQPVVRSFQVFFDFDRSDIRPDARPIIEEAANNARRGNVSRINLTGHADRAGPAAYNQRLSERRAAAVKAEFVRMGFNPNEIVTVGKGEADPLVPTPDGVREPKNRRVEIVF